MFTHKYFTINNENYTLFFTFELKQRILIQVDIFNEDGKELLNWICFLVKNDFIDFYDSDIIFNNTDTNFDLSNNEDFKRICNFYLDKYLKLKAFL